MSIRPDRVEYRTALELLGPNKYAKTVEDMQRKHDRLLATLSSLGTLLLRQGVQIDNAAAKPPRTLTCEAEIAFPRQKSEPLDDNGSLTLEGPPGYTVTSTLERYGYNPAKVAARVDITYSDQNDPPTMSVTVHSPSALPPAASEALAEAFEGLPFSQHPPANPIE